MFVTFTPDDGEPRVWEFDPDDVISDEMVAIEKQFGATWTEFCNGCMQGQTAARRVLLWHLIRRDGNKLPFRDVPGFRNRELLVERSHAEVVATYDEWLAAGGPSHDNGELMAGMFEAEIKAAAEKYGESAGKALSKNGPADTSG